MRKTPRFEEMNQTFKTSVKSNYNSDAGSYVNKCIQKYYMNILTSNQHIRMKCHLAEYLCEAKLLPTLTRDKFNELFSKVFYEILQYFASIA